jgi:Rieske Fe-S protein
MNTDSQDRLPGAEVPARPLAPPGDSGQTRRDFLASVLVAGTAAPAAAGALAMGLRYVLPPSKQAMAELLMCRVDEVPPGESRIFDNVLGNRICLLRESHVPPVNEHPATYSPFRAFSLRCSHLGCFAHWEGGVRKFVCPCHNAVFDENGQVIAGPPPAGLQRIAVEVRGDLVYMKVPYVQA